MCEKSHIKFQLIKLNFFFLQNRKYDFATKEIVICQVATELLSFIATKILIVGSKPNRQFRQVV